MRLAGGVIGITALAFMLSSVVIRCFDPINFPIREVLFVGEQGMVSSEVLQETIIDHLSLGFFRLRVREIQEALLDQPWIKQVDVRKRWPSRLVIKIDEHSPAARWGEKGMISTTGEVFFPQEHLETFADFPVLEGPNVKRSLIWQYYLRMESILSSHGLSVSRLSLAPRGAWQMKLSNGIIIHLGKDDVMKRLKRFVRVYETHLQSKRETMKYVDLRYTQGLAIGWETGLSLENP